MSGSDRQQDSVIRPRSLRRRLSLPLSVALHAVAFYAIGLVPWAASEIPEPERKQREVFWLDQALQVPDPSAVEPAAATNEPAEPVAPPPDSSAASPSPPPPTTIEQAASTTPSTTPAPSAPPRDSSAASPSPAPDETPERVASEQPSVVSELEAPAPLSEVDWEKQRHDAVRDVLNRPPRRGYLTFSIDDLVEEPKPVDPLPLPLVVDNCVIVKGRLARFAALMTGRCVREARGDLFAAIKPAYLKARPVCIETRPDNPGSFLSDGREISTVKCELVAAEGE